MGGFENAFREIGELVETFKNGIHHYKSSQYSEAQARKDFIDNFWIALGWDVNHRIQKNPYEQEVKVERGVPVGGTQRRADYAFYLAPNYHDVKFLVEAKKPAVDITSADSCFQLIRYGWNSDTPLAVLTDFEQFLVLDCRYKPDIATAPNQVVQKYYYTDYTDKEKLEKIYWLFSREAVEQGSIEKRADELPKPRGKAVQRGLFPGGYQSIDSSFLAELDEHRMSLAKNFKNHNPELESETLTELAQRTLDRLVFLRFLEDKGIEPARLVENFGTKGSAWEDFIATCRRLDGIYNGIVYKHHDILDGKDFHVDDKAFSQIRDSLAHANSPYDFNSIPIHILGSIYERFLGKVIVATDKRAKVEEKPEVRKAGGVYYTPQYIVRYIVKNTVGKLIEGRSPAEIAKMRFADIACGSGSFLLAVYDLLLDYHGHYYNDHPDKAQKGDCVERDGKLYLTLAKKREILLNNIYGVDIDAQAVEVCQLSLYLKLLQDETEASAHQYLLDFARDARLKKLLPDLSRNIRCGNSLIGPDFYEQQGDLFDTKESRRINAFDWQSKEHGFGEIMSQGGFDAVIGNPPYGAYLDIKGKDYLSEKYKHQSYQLDSYLLFLELSVSSLLKAGGYYGMIIPNPWLTNILQREIRKFVTEETRVREIVHFRFPVFPKVTVDNEIVILEKNDPNGWKPLVTIVDELREIQTDEAKRITHEQKQWQDLDGDVINIFLRSSEKSLANKCTTHSEHLDMLCKINVGIKPYQTGKGSPPQTIEIVKARLYDSNRRIDSSYKKYLRGCDINRYIIQPQETRYLKYGPWLAEPRPAADFDAPEKIFMRQTGDSLIAAIDSQKFLCLNNMHVLVPTVQKPSLAYVLGAINSKLLNWYYHTLNPEIGEALAEVKKTNVAQLPIRTIDFNEKNDKTMHDRMVELVEVMLKLNKELHEQKLSDRDREALERRIDYTDREIDKLVYKLYDLTEDEIKIVESEK